MGKHYRMVIEVDVELNDDTWTEEELLENGVLFFQRAIDRAEEESGPGGPYTVDAEDIELWTQAGYAADHYDQMMDLGKPDD